ncbi:hypothetical protein SSX86_033073 [Deinandra increscens subsp. villosa]|uniref:RING-type domain-containing protein n=1 Tax=Deinandra increscens subsp. villosa TaxID=3103831 RepID=A0AAP0C2U0_9ASTR
MVICMLHIANMMMMIMIAGFVDSVTTPIKSWLDNGHDKTTTALTMVGVLVDGSRVEDCIVCLSQVALGDRFAMLQRCKHVFHADCVEAWLKDHPNCPLCRTPVVSGDDRVFLRKSCEIMSRYGFQVMETIATWLTSSFSRGLQSSLSESCNYL